MISFNTLAHIYRSDWQFILGHPVRFEADPMKREVDPKIIYGTSVVKIGKDILQPLFSKELLAFAAIEFVDRMFKELNYQEFIAVAYRYWLKYPQKIIAQEQGVNRRTILRWEEYARRKFRSFVRRNQERYNLLFEKGLDKEEEM